MDAALSINLPVQSGFPPRSPFFATFVPQHDIRSIPCTHCPRVRLLSPTPTIGRSRSSNGVKRWTMDRTCGSNSPQQQHIRDLIYCQHSIIRITINTHMRSPWNLLSCSSRTQSLLSMPFGRLISPFNGHFFTHFALLFIEHRAPSSTFALSRLPSGTLRSFRSFVGKRLDPISASTSPVFLFLVISRLSNKMRKKN